MGQRSQRAGTDLGHGHRHEDAPVSGRGRGHRRWLGQPAAGVGSRRCARSSAINDMVAKIRQQLAAQRVPLRLAGAAVAGGCRCGWRVPLRLAGAGAAGGCRCGWRVPACRCAGAAGGCRCGWRVPVRLAGAGAAGGCRCGWRVPVRLAGAGAAGGCRCGWRVPVRLAGAAAAGGCRGAAVRLRLAAAGAAAAGGWRLRLRLAAAAGGCRCGWRVPLRLAGAAAAGGCRTRGALPQNACVPLDRVIVPPNWSAGGPRASSSDGMPLDPGPSPILMRCVATAGTELRLAAGRVVTLPLRRVFMEIGTLLNAQEQHHIPIEHVCDH